MTDRRTGAVLGALAAGIGLSAVMLLGEILAGKPSELIELERKTAGKLGVDTRHGDAPATISEQLVTHGGHLALSALSGSPMLPRSTRSAMARAAASRSGWRSSLRPME